MGKKTVFIDELDLLFDIDVIDKKRWWITDKKNPVKGKRYSRSFPFDRNFAGSVSRPFSSKLVVWAGVATITVTESNSIVQYSMNSLT
jgi:hypothetical protein